MDNINRENFRLLMAGFIEHSNLTVRKAAKAIGCTEPTLTRLLASKTWPSDEMMKQGGILFELGFDRYSKLSMAQKEKISDTIGAVGGTTLGFGAITAAISALGVPGLSAVGITSGLAVLGSLVGGGMLVGVSVAAAIPLAAGALGYGIIKAIKYFIEENVVERENYDPFWERPLEM
jgi:hypothetical protein